MKGQELIFKLYKMDPIKTSLAPWLNLRNANKAISFYKEAFDAIETYRLDAPPEAGVVVKLSIQGVEFWISDGAEQDSAKRESVGGGTIRMILTVANPETFFEKALNAGATEIFPIGEEHGWKLGRIMDPFGLHWEIGYPLNS